MPTRSPKAISLLTGITAQAPTPAPKDGNGKDQFAKSEKPTRPKGTPKDYQRMLALSTSTQQSGDFADVERPNTGTIAEVEVDSEDENRPISRFIGAGNLPTAASSKTSTIRTRTYSSTSASTARRKAKTSFPDPVPAIPSGYTNTRPLGQGITQSQILHTRNPSTAAIEKPVGSKTLGCAYMCVKTSIS